MPTPKSTFLPQPLFLYHLLKTKNFVFSNPISVKTQLFALSGAPSGILHTSNVRAIIVKQPGLSSPFSLNVHIISIFPEYQPYHFKLNR